MASQIERRNPDRKIVYSAGSDGVVQAKVAFLLGCHLIMSKALDTNHVLQVFKGVEGLMPSDGRGLIGILDCWRAVERARSDCWIDFQERFDMDRNDSRTIDMEELIHYSRWHT